MRLKIKRLLQYCVGFVLQFFPGRNPSLFRVFTFHGVPDAQALDRLLGHLVEAYDVITPQEAEALISGKPLGRVNDKTPYLVTFDDGFRCHGRLVKDLLARHGIKAVFFICPGLMEMPPVVQRGATARCVYDSSIPEAAVPDENLPLSWREAEGLLKAGHTIGAHTWEHKRLFDVDDRTLAHELGEPISAIKKNLGVTPDWFAFPFGDIKSVDERSFELARQRYRFCCSNIPAANTPESVPLILFRMGFDLQSPFIYQQMVLTGGIDFRYAKDARALLEMVGRSKTVQSAGALP